MKSVLVAAIVSAVTMLAVPAFAASTPFFAAALGQQPSGEKVYLQRPTGVDLPGAGVTFTDEYTFSVMSLTNVDTTLSVSGSPKSVKPTGVTLSLYDIKGNKLDMVDALEELNDDLGLGMYYFVVSGLSHGSDGSYSAPVSFSMTTVPLPNSVALFGVAIAGFGMAGAARRRSLKAAAA